MKTHYIKNTVRYFILHVLGTKNFLIVENNGRYVEGDIIVLQEIETHSKELTGRKLELEIIYIIDDHVGLSNGYLILGTKILDGQ